MQTIEQNLEKTGILTLMLSRPEKLNALNQTMLEELEQSLKEAAADKQVKAILLTGTGKAFSAGADISQLATYNALEGYEFAAYGQKVFRLLETLGKPSLAAVNGFAFGGGCELAMAATLRMASTSAKFGQPEVKLGIIPGYGGTQRLARLVGKGRALDLCLSGRFIDAKTALDWGLVSLVVEPELLLEEGKRYLANMLKMSSLALSAVMTVIDKGYDLDLNDALHLEALHFANLCATEDKREGVAAFLEKRDAVFLGK